MTTIELLSDLRRREIRLWLEGDQLRYGAPKGALTPELRAQLTDRKAEIIAFLRQTTGGIIAAPIQPVARTGPLPLSFAQQRLWFLDQLSPGMSGYHIPAAVRMSGHLDVAALQWSLDTIVSRHEILRTTFGLVEDQPVQVIAPTSRIPLPVEDLRHLPASKHEAAVLGRVAEEAQRPFDLARGPLLRASLLQLADDEHVALFTLHHIITDLWSMGILIQEIAGLYSARLTGQPARLPDLPIQYADFAVWQRQWLQSESGRGGSPLQQQLVYWRQQLGGELPVLELPTDRPRPPVQTFVGETETAVLPQSLSAALHALSQREGVTLFMTLLAAFQTLMHRYTAQTDILVGSPIAGRIRTEVEPLIGFFVNTLVLRCDLSGDPTFRMLLGRVRETTLAAYAHQDLPFEMLVEDLHPVRDLSRTPLFQVMFALQNVTNPTIELPGLSLRPIEINSGMAAFDVTFLVIEQERELKCVVEYNVDLFEAATLKRLLEHFQTLLEGIVADPDRRVSALPLLREAERHQLLVEWNQTIVPCPHELCVHQLFEAQAARTPDADAVVFGERRLSYRELNVRANQLAHYLRALDVGPEMLVGVCMERSLELAVALLGILKAGGAYLPLDPSYPAERLRFMLEDAQVSVLLTTTIEDSSVGDTTSLSSILYPLSSGRVVDLRAEWDTIASQPATDLDSLATLDNLAYVIYTSGSTGRPKGAMIVHRGLSNYLAWASQAYPVEAGRGAPVHSSISFDLTITGLFVPLLVGRAVHLLPEHLGVETLSEALVAANDFSLVKITPAHLELLAQQLGSAQAAGRTRAFIVGGEQLLAETVAFWRHHAPTTLLVNEYGPTETVVGCCVYTVSPETPPSGVIPIGRPIANTELYVLDRQLQLMPVGVPGELYIGGAGVARGYLGRPELTAERFVPNPFATTDDGQTAGNGGRWSVVGGRLYKTGDLCRYLPDGNIEYLGRIDQQVKIRGFRIELGEIEAALAQHPGVREALVVARESEQGDKRLVAYVVPKTEDRGLKIEDSPESIQGKLSSELRAFLKTTLPDYMVPSVFVLLERLPLSPNGKVDRKALPAQEGSRAELGGKFEAPRTPVEETVASLLAQVLGIERVGIHDNFFDLGGHSLLATRMVSRLREAFAIDLPLRSLFESPTVAGLAEHVEAVQWAAQETLVLSDNTEEERQEGEL